MDSQASPDEPKLMESGSPGRRLVLIATAARLLKAVLAPDEPEADMVMSCPEGVRVMPEPATSTAAPVMPLILVTPLTLPPPPWGKKVVPLIAIYQPFGLSCRDVRLPVPPGVI